MGRVRHDNRCHTEIGEPDSSADRVRGGLFSHRESHLGKPRNRMREAMPVIIQDRTNKLLRRPPRPHPYARVRHDSEGQYYDFKARPDLIETVLEDFTPHSAYPGVQQFYALLKHINRENGPFETTDCGLSQKLYRSANSPFPEKAGWVGGRVMLIWRQLDKNCRPKTVRQLLKRFRRELKRVGKPHKYIGFIVGPFPTRFHRTGRKGYQIDIEFAMWGNSFEESMQRFPDVVSMLDETIKNCEASS